MGASKPSVTGVEWFNGDPIVDTGRREFLHGAWWRVCIFQDGLRRGEECWRPLRAFDVKGAS